MTCRFAAFTAGAFSIALLLSSCATDPEIENARNQLRSQGIPFNTKAFSKASAEGKNDVLAIFLKGGMDVNVHDDETALISAVLHNRKDTVKYLLDNGADPNEASYLGSPLFIASKYGFYDIAKMLILAGAEPEFENKAGTSILIEAVKNKHLEVVQLLVDAGADIENEDSFYGRTPIFFAAQNGDKEILAYLIESGASVNQKDVNMNDPLSLASEGGFPEIIDLLIEKGCKPCDSKGAASTAVLFACSVNKNNVLDTFFAKGLSPNCFAPNGIPLLSWCIKNKYYDSAKTIIKNGADLKLPDNDGETPYDYALSSDKDFLDYFKALAAKSESPPPQQEPSADASKKSE